MTPEFTPVSSLVGGLLIGLSASLLLFSHGKVSGISGIYGGLLTPPTPDRSYRVSFLGGLVSAGIVLYLLRPDLFPAADVTAPAGLTALAGILVGYGTRLGNGCTSGHGVCGLARFSRRSLVATVSFIAAGAATVLIVRTLGGVG
ncbi:MAG: YeeE/YedE family protein [Myxococcales bacterium]|nr:YeeE/YedE family protein [Myxococcales bacterium]MCB9732564.1 YeeE/YedE family protein [Deltaproteobacteria bacterium]